MISKHKILFVCLGNICRSPAADGIMHCVVGREGLASEVEIDSAGTYGGHRGELPDPRMRTAAAARGYELTHRSRKFVAEDFERFDMIIVMDDQNYHDVYRQAPSRQEGDKVYRFVEFCTRFADRSYVPDPYCEGREGFELVLDMVEDGCEGILERIKSQTRN